MKIIIYNPDGIVSPLLYSVIKEKVEQGNEVIVVECDGGFKGCSYNLNGSKLVCNYCIKKRELCKKNLDLNDEIYKTIKINKLFTPFVLKNYNFNKFSDYQKYLFKGVDVGYASISTVVNDFREYNVEKFNKFQKATLDKIFESCHDYVNACEKILKIYEPDLVILFNGRLISTRPMVRLCQNSNVNFKIYEICKKGGHVNIFDNTLPHDSSAFYNKSKQFWEEAPIKHKVVLAENFFINKRNNIFTNDTVYTDKQNTKNLELIIDKKKQNIVIFNSSQDELVAIGDDYATGLYNSQSEAVIKITEKLDPNLYHIYLRIHPNLDGVNSNDLLNLTKLSSKYTHLTVIMPNSTVSSYLLLDIANIVLTFGSTIGIEATYWGKPSILLNKAIWGNYEVAYRPNSKDDLYKLLEINTEITPKPKINTYPISYYMSEYGQDQLYFSGSYHRGHFLANKSCQPKLYYRFFYIFYKISNQIKSGNKLLNRKLIVKAKKILNISS